MQPNKPDRPNRPNEQDRLADCCSNLLAFRATGEEGIDEAGEGAAQDRRDPEEPELLQGPAVGKDGRGGAARRVEGEIRDRDPGPILDQGHGQADRQRREALRRPAVRRAQNDQEEKEGEDRFGAEAGLVGRAHRGNGRRTRWRRSRRGRSRPARWR